MRTPRVLFLDIETAPARGRFWGKVYETDIIKVDKPWFMLCYAWQWMGEKKIHYKGLPDITPHYAANLTNDFFLVKELRNLLDEADVVIAHNGDRFDIPMIRARMARYRIDPPSNFRTVDTLKTCQSQFRLESNKLNYVAEFLGVGRKIPHTGLDLWSRCEEGDEKAWPVMKRYNKHDVYLLKEVYTVIRPWISNHPDLTLYDKAKHGPVRCPACRSGHIHKRGLEYTKAARYQAWACYDCKRRFRGERLPWPT